MLVAFFSGIRPRVGGVLSGKRIDRDTGGYYEVGGGYTASIYKGGDEERGDRDEIMADFLCCIYTYSEFGYLIGVDDGDGGSEGNPGGDLEFRGGK